MRDYLAQAIFKAVEFDFHNVHEIMASSLGRKMSLNFSSYAHCLQTPSGIMESGTRAGTRAVFKSFVASASQVLNQVSCL